MEIKPETSPPMSMEICSDALTYTKLDDSECSIRLLQVSPNLCNGRVQVSMSQCRMPTRYRCVSYMWGAECEYQEILVNGSTLRVRKNLHDFLEMARRRLPGRLLWIDAVCINQDDNIEKSHQVQRMGSIFREASEVLVWLGVSPSLNYVFDFVNSLVKSFAPLTKSSDLRRLTSPDSERIDIGLQELCSNPYWSRAWIVQEILLAQQVRIMNGSNQVEWRSLVRAIKEVRTVIPNRPHDELLYNSPAMKFWEEWPWSWGQYHMRRTIWHLDWVWTSQCVDPRDRIYSLLALLEDENFRVDYEEDICSLFWRAGEYFRAWNSAHSLKSLMQALDLDATTLEHDLRNNPQRRATLTVSSVNFRDETDPDPEFCDVCGTRLHGMSRKDMSLCISDLLDIRRSQHAILSPTSDGSFTIALRSSYKIGPRLPPRILGAEALQYFVDGQLVKTLGLPTWRMDIPGSMFRILLPAEFVVDNLKAVSGEGRQLRSHQSRFSDDEFTRLSSLPWGGVRRS